MSRSRIAPVFALLALAPFGAVLACGGSEPPPAVARRRRRRRRRPRAPSSVTNIERPSDAERGLERAPRSAHVGLGRRASPRSSRPTLRSSPAIAAAAASATPAKTQPAGGAGELAKGLAAIALKGAPGMKPDGASPPASSRREITSAGRSPSRRANATRSSDFRRAARSRISISTSCRRRFSRCSRARTRRTTTRRSWVRRRTRCAPSSPVQLPYKVDITAQKGAGHAAVQLFSKAN